MSERDRSMKLGSQNTWRTCGMSRRHTPRHISRGINSLYVGGGGRVEKKSEPDEPGSFVSGFSLKSFPTVQIACVLQRNVCHYKESLPTLSFKHNKVEKKGLSPTKHQWEWKCCWAPWGVALVYHTTSEAWADRCSPSKTSPPHLKNAQRGTLAFYIIPRWNCPVGKSVIHCSVQTMICKVSWSFCLHTYPCVCHVLERLTTQIVLLDVKWTY